MTAPAPGPYRLLLELAQSALQRMRARTDVARASETLQLEQMRETFRRYVSPRIADQILANADLRDSMLTRSDYRTRAVVMFADMRGFTRLSEKLAPQDVVSLLNEYFSLLTGIAFRHDGTVFSMAGDCLMIGFGVPVEQADALERAVRAGREMLDRFAVLAIDWRARFGIDTGLGIGINEGEVVAGNVGSPEFMNYTIIGDTVNVASRLCQRARSGEMLFSAEVKAGLDARGISVGAMELPAMALRGRTNPIDIYCVPIERRWQLSPQPLLQA